MANERQRLTPAQIEYFFGRQNGHGGQRGLMRIQTLIEDARNIPDVPYTRRWEMLDEARRLAEAIPQANVSETYSGLVSVAEKDVDKKYAQPVDMPPAGARR